MRNRQLQPASQPLEITSLIYVSTNCLPTCSHQIPRNSMDSGQRFLDERLMLILGWQKSYAFIKLDSSALLLAKFFKKI
jgi:hypothetical protein